VADVVVASSSAINNMTNNSSKARTDEQRRSGCHGWQWDSEPGQRYSDFGYHRDLVRHDRHDQALS
jgi:hypothetical protein